MHKLLLKGGIAEIPAEWQEELPRIVQESLTNTLKHARARNFKATLKVVAEKSELELIDDGRGFDPQAEHEGFGLVGMKERVEQNGGQFVLQSRARKGTRIRVLLANGASIHSNFGNERA